MNIKTQDGTIIREKNSGKMFLMSHGRRRWILTIEAAEQFNLDLSQYEEYSDEELKQIPIGGPIVQYPKSLELCKTTMEARAYLAKNLTGQGIECGPGTDSNCYPLPLNVSVKYLDRFDNDAGCNQDYEGEFPQIDYHTTLNEMEGIDNNSLDFIVHCHVIEHSRNPVQALEKAYQKLKSGGTLIMAIPDKRYTFDKPRTLTKVKHIMEDYEYGVTAERDLEHVHCCKKIWVGSGYKMIWDMSEDEIKEYLNKDMIDIHWHTYTDRSFRKLLKKSSPKIPWTSTTVIPIKKFTQRENFIEFYVILRK